MLRWEGDVVSPGRLARPSLLTTYDEVVVCICGVDGI